MNKILLNILGLFTLIALGVLVYIAYMGLTTFERQVNNEARYQCALSSTYEVVDGDATVSYPVADIYEKCLDEKGIN